MKKIPGIISVLDGIWKDRNLLVSLSLKDFQRKFSGTYFGVVWAIVQPLLTITVYWAAFEFGFRSGSVGEIPFAVWFMCGMVPWLYISESFSTASNSFVEYSYLIKKVKFNTNILPLVKILSAFCIHLLFCIIVTIVACCFGIMPTIYIVQIIYYMVCTIAFLFGISLITSSIVVFFRDLNQVISVFLLVGMWGTPIAWSLDSFGVEIQKILKLNPFYYLVEGYRDAILGRCWFWEKTELLIYFWIWVIVLWLIGGKVYTKLKPHFADTV